MLVPCAVDNGTRVILRCREPFASQSVNRNNSIKLYASQGVFSRTGNGYDLFGIAWQYRWGAGL